MSDGMEELRKEVEGFVAKMKSAAATAEDYSKNLSTLSSLNTSLENLSKEIINIVESANEMVSSLKGSFSSELVSELKNVSGKLRDVEGIVGKTVAEQSEKDKAFHKNVAGSIIKNLQKGGNDVLIYVTLGISGFNTLLLLSVLIFK